MAPGIPQSVRNNNSHITIQLDQQGPSPVGNEEFRDIRAVTNQPTTMCLSRFLPTWASSGLTGLSDFMLKPVAIVKAFINQCGRQIDDHLLLVKNDIANEIERLEKIHGSEKIQEFRRALITYEAALRADPDSESTKVLFETYNNLAKELGLKGILAQFTQMAKNSCLHLRQPLHMCQFYYAQEAKGISIPGASVSGKIGVHGSLILTSKFFSDSLQKRVPTNGQVLIQLFPHLEAGVSAGLNSEGLVRAGAYAAVIHHFLGIGFPIYKNEAGYFVPKHSDLSLISEEVERVEVSTSLNTEGLNLQLTVGGNYVSQRIFNLDENGVRNAMIRLGTQLTGGTAGGWAASYLSCDPGTIFVGATGGMSAGNTIANMLNAFNVASPDKIVPILEVSTVGVDGGYTHSSDFGFRSLNRLNAGAAYEETPPTVVNKRPEQTTDNGSQLRQRTPTRRDETIYF